MKKSLLNHKKTERSARKLVKFNRERVMRAFRELGYAEDFISNSVTVLRNLEFPFQRITLPNNAVISSELLKLYAADLKIDFNSLLKKVTA